MVAGCQREATKNSDPNLAIQGIAFGSAADPVVWGFATDLKNGNGGTAGVDHKIFTESVIYVDPLFGDEFWIGFARTV